MKGDLIPDVDHVSRYCVPRYVNRQSGLPEIDAFRLRRDRGEDSLSVNWIEYFNCLMALDTRDEREGALAKVREVMQYDLDVRGVFAFFGVDEVKQAVEAGGGTDPYIEHDPRPCQPASGRRPARGPDPSHALVFRFPHDDYGVGVQLRAMATLDCDLRIFPGVASSGS